MELTPAQISQLASTKQYYPYRIVFAVVEKGTGEFYVRADHDKRKMNKAAREGHHVVLIS